MGRCGDSRCPRIVMVRAGSRPPTSGFRLLAHNATALTREFVSRCIDAVEKDPNVFEVDGVPISTIKRWTATAKARLERLERS